MVNNIEVEKCYRLYAQDTTLVLDEDPDGLGLIEIRYEEGGNKVSFTSQDALAVAPLLMQAADTIEQGAEISLTAPYERDDAGQYLISEDGDGLGLVAIEFTYFEQKNYLSFEPEMARAAATAMEHMARNIESRDADKGAAEDIKKIKMLASRVRRLLLTAPVDEDFPEIVGDVDLMLTYTEHIESQGDVYTDFRDKVAAWRKTKMGTDEYRSLRAAISEDVHKLVDLNLPMTRAEFKEMLVGLSPAAKALIENNVEPPMPDLMKIAVVDAFRAKIEDNRTAALRHYLMMLEEQSYLEFSS